jgi:hypothetical protein
MCASSNTLAKLSHFGIRTYNVLVRVGDVLTPLVLGTLYDLVVMYIPRPYLQTLALPIFGCSLALVSWTVSLPLSRYTLRIPFSQVVLPFVSSTATP